MRDDILKILAEAGSEGLRVRKIVLHVYNAQNNLFQTASLEEVKRGVLSFLKQNSRYPQDLLQHCSWGVYRLNPNSPKARQVRLSFSPVEENSSCPDDQPKPVQVAGPKLDGF